MRLNVCKQTKNQNFYLGYNNSYTWENCCTILYTLGIINKRLYITDCERPFHKI